MNFSAAVTVVRSVNVCEGIDVWNQQGLYPFLAQEAWNTCYRGRPILWINLHPLRQVHQRKRTKHLQNGDLEPFLTFHSKTDLFSIQHCPKSMWMLRILKHLEVSSRYNNI